MRPWVVLSLLPAIAHADATADRELLVEYRRLAIEAARAGNCEPARELASQVQTRDPTFFANEYATDPAIAPCLPPPTSPAAIGPVGGGPPVGEGVPLAPPSEQPVASEVPPVAYPSPRPRVPELDGGRIVGEILVGGLMSSAGLLVGGVVGLAFCDDSGGDDPCLGPVIIGAYLGASVAFGVGVGLVGHVGAQTGSMAAAIGGALLGSVIGVVALFAAEDAGLTVPLLVGAPMAGAVVGFNLTRRWKDPGPMVVGSLLRLDRGGISLGVPMVMHGEARGVPTTTLSLFSGSF